MLVQGLAVQVHHRPVGGGAHRQQQPLARPFLRDGQGAAVGAVHLVDTLVEVVVRRLHAGVGQADGLAAALAAKVFVGKAGDEVPAVIQRNAFCHWGNSSPGDRMPRSKISTTWPRAS